MMKVGYCYGMIRLQKLGKNQINKWIFYDEFVETYEYTEEVYLVSYDEFEHDPLPFDTSEELIEDFIFHETVLIADYEDVDTLYRI